MELLNLEEDDRPSISDVRERDFIDKPKKSKSENDKQKKVWGKMFSKSKLKRSNAVAVVYLRRNGSAEPMVVESKRGFFNINNKTYHEDKDCVYRIKVGKEVYPLAMIPEWNVIPIGREEWDDKPMQEKFHTLQDHVMKGIRHAERVRMGEKEPVQFNGKAIVGIIILVVIGGAFLLQYVGA